MITHNELLQCILFLFQIITFNSGEILRNFDKIYNNIERKIYMRDANYMSYKYVMRYYGNCNFSNNIFYIEHFVIISF